MRRSWLRAAPAVLLFLLAIGLWQFLVGVTGVQTWLLPSPSTIFETLGSSLGLLLPNLVVTLEETLLGFLLSLLLGVLLAVGMRFSRILKDAVYPWVVISQTLPIVAIAPLLMFWFGFGVATKVMVVVLFAFFPIVVGMTDGLRSVPDGLSDMARTFGAGNLRVFWTVEAPYALPHLFTSMRLAITYAVVGAVVGEWVGAEAGLGYLLIRASSQIQTPLLFADVVLLALLGLLLFGAVGLLEHWAIPWHSKERQARL